MPFAAASIDEPAAAEPWRQGPAQRIELALDSAENAQPAQSLSTPAVAFAELQSTGDWLRQQLSAGYALLTRKQDPTSRHPVVRRIARRVVFRLATALVAKLLTRFVHPMAGVLMQMYIELIRQKDELNVTNYVALKALLQAFIDLPSGNDRDRELAALQNVMKPLASLIDLFDEGRSGALGLESASNHLGRLSDTLASEDVVLALPDGYAAQLIEGMNLLQSFINDLTVAGSAAAQIKPLGYLQAFGQSRLLAAMLPAELAWLAEFFVELADVLQKIRDLAGDAERGPVDKGWAMALVILDSRLGHLFAPQLQEWLRPLRGVLKGAADDEVGAFDWLSTAGNLDRMQAAADPAMQATSAHLAELGKGATDIQGFATLPGSPAEQLGWGIELLSNKPLRALLQLWFGARVMEPLTQIFDLLEQAPRRPLNNSLAAQAAWTSALFAMPKLQSYLAETLSPAGVELLRSSLDWTLVSQQLLILKQRRDKDASWASQAREAITGLGQIFMRQVANPAALTTLAKGAALYGRLRSDPEAVMVLSAYIAIREIPDDWTLARDGQRWLYIIWDRISALPGIAGKAAYYLRWIARGLNFAWKWARSPSTDELESWLEMSVRQVKLATGVSGAGALALDLVPLAPALWEAFSQSGQGKGADLSAGQRGVRLLEHLLSSSSPALKRAGASIESAVVNGLADAVGSALPEGQAPLLGALSFGASAAPIGPPPSIATGVGQGLSARCRVPSAAQLRVDTLGGHYHAALLGALLFGGVALSSAGAYLRERTAARNPSLRVPQEDSGPADDATHPLDSAASVTPWGTLAGLSISAAAFSGAMAIYNWREREKAIEAATQLERVNWLDRPMIEGQRTTFAQGIEACIRRTHSDAEAILGDPLRLEAAVRQLLTSVEQPDDPVSDSTGRHRRDLQSKLPAESGAVPDQHSALHVAQRDGRVEVLANDELSGKEQTLVLEGDPDALAAKTAFELLLHKYQVEAGVAALRQRAVGAGVLPAHLTSLDEFAEYTGARIHANYYNRPFDPDEAIPLRYEVFEDNPLVYLVMPATQPVMSLRRAYARLQGPDAVERLEGNAVNEPFWNRQMFGTNGRIELTPRQLLAGRLYGKLGQNAYNIEIDPQRSAADQGGAPALYLQALRDYPTVEKYQQQLQTHMDEQRPALIANYKRRLFDELKDAVGSKDYSPSSRIEQGLASLHPVFAGPAKRYKIFTPAFGSPRREWSGHQRILQTVRYIDASANIDIILFMANHTVIDAYHPGSAALTAGTDAASWPVSTTAVEVTDISLIAQVLQGTAHMDNELYDAIAATVGRDERDYAEALRDVNGQRVYNDAFIKRLENSRHKAVSKDRTTPSKLKLITERAETLDQLADHDVRYLQESLQSAADHQSRSKAEQALDYYTHKFEFVINLFAAALTVVGGSPLSIATVAGRSAWLTALFSSTATSLARMTAAENVDEQRALLTRWLTTVVSESLLWGMAEFGVPRIAERVLASKPGKAVLLSRRRLLELQPQLESPRFLRYVDEYYGALAAGADPVVREAYDESIKTALRKSIEQALNASLVSSAFWGYPALQEAVLNLDWEALDVPEAMAERNPSFKRNSAILYENANYAGKTVRRRLPRNTLSAATRTSQAWKLVREDGLLVAQADKDPDVGPDDPRNRWIKLDWQVGLGLPGRYRNFDRTSYYLLNDDTPWSRFEAEQYRLLKENGTWRAERVIRTPEQRVADREQRRAAQSGQTQAPADDLTPYEPAVAWQIDVTGAKYRAVPVPSYNAQENRWQKVSVDDPSEPGLYVRIANRATYRSYRHQRYGRSQPLYQLETQGGLWRASEQASASTYAPWPDLQLLEASEKAQAEDLRYAKAAQTRLDLLEPKGNQWAGEQNMVISNLNRMEAHWTADGSAVGRLDVHVSQFQVDQLSTRHERVKKELNLLHQEHAQMTQAFHDRYARRQDFQVQWQNYNTLKRTGRSLTALQAEDRKLEDEAAGCDKELRRLDRDTTVLGEDRKAVLRNRLQSIATSLALHMTLRSRMSTEIRGLLPLVSAGQRRNYERKAPPLEPYDRPGVYY